MIQREYAPEQLPAPVRGELGSIYGPRCTTPRQRIDFYHGMTDETPGEMILETLWQRQRWVLHHYGSDAFEDKPLLEGYTAYDYGNNGQAIEDMMLSLGTKDQYRISSLLSQNEGEHAGHHFVRLRPFCPTCRIDGRAAQLSLASYLIRNKKPIDVSDRDLNWDTELIPRPKEGKESDEYVNLDQLDGLRAPVDLIEGIIPRRGVGYITGRDRSLKTFLALDICLHVAFMSQYWHEASPKFGEPRVERRTCNWRHLGRILYAAGEGVNSFNPRIQAWEQAQHIRDWTGSKITTPDGHRMIRYDDCARCQRETDPAVGHVNHLELDEPDNLDNSSQHKFSGRSTMEKQNILVRKGAPNFFTGGEDYQYMLSKAREWRPDVIVIDTLALAAGAADQQSAVDMGMIHARAKELELACKGVVIIIAHTDKGDNDARGSSVIEDNSDFVLHVKRDSDENEEIEVKVAKRKDAPDNWSFMMAAEKVDLGFGQDSLILTDWDGEASKSRDEEKLEGIDKMMRIAADEVVERKHNFFTRGELLNSWDKHPSDRTVRRLLIEAIEVGKLTRTGPADSKDGRTPVRYHLADEVLEQLVAGGLQIAPFVPDGA